MARAVLGLGSNLGARRAILRCARALLGAQPGLAVLGTSRLYHTPPLGPPQPDYLNAALAVDWVGSARALLALTQHVESLLRRERTQRWGPRTLDIDILWWSEGPVSEPGLTIPHAGLMQRPFALMPLLEVAPELAPELGASPAHVDFAFAPAEPFAELDSPVASSVSLAPGADGLEWLSAFARGVGLLLFPPAPPRVTLPFVCPVPNADPAALRDALATLQARITGAARHGFFTQNAAILNVGQGRCEGVLVGGRGDLSSPMPRLEWTLDTASQAPSLRLTRA